jgi:hypothetical protein
MIVRVTLAVIGVLLTSIFFSGLGVVPVLAFIPLGFMFESQRSVATTGSLRGAIPDAAAWIAFWKKALLFILLSLPLALVDLPLRRASLINPDNHLFAFWSYVSPALWIATIVHLLLANLRGGGRQYLDLAASIRCLFQADPAPRHSAFGEGAAYLSAVIARSILLFTRGVRGYVAVAGWLLVPAVLIYFAKDDSWMQGVGATMLAISTPLAALAGVRFAVEDRIIAAWDIRDLFRRIWRAPWSVVLAILLIDLLTAPLLILKIERPIWEFAWVFNFLCFWAIFPTRLLTAWSYRRADFVHPRFGFVRVPFGFIGLGVVSAAYALTLFWIHPMTWFGTRLPFVQHAFLLPIIH